MYTKSFDKWNSVKKHLNDEKGGVYCRAGEVRWVSIGVNVGSEMDGKGDSFNRPCIIADVFTDKLALVFPMTTSNKKSAGYVPLTLVDGREVSVCIHQARVISPKRVLTRIQVISKPKLQEFKEQYKKFYRL